MGRKKEVLVISFGGSVLLSQDADYNFFNELKAFLHSLSKNYRLFIIIGGGKTARFYIEMGRKHRFLEHDLDQLGILSTRINATFLSMLLGLSTKTIPESVQQAIAFDDDIVVMGGTTAGHSTDFVGACLAAQTNAKIFFVATNVDGVYDKDPRVHTDAIYLPEISIDTLLGTYGNKWEAAGKNMVIDGPALQKIKDNKIPTYVINGKNFQEIMHILQNESFRGTKIL